MYQINRSVAVVKPKKPLLDWIATLPEPDNRPLSEEEQNNDCLSFLIPEFDTWNESIDYVRGLSDFIFVNVMEFCCSDRDYWIIDRSPENFDKWFKVEIHSMVFDLQDEDIERDLIIRLD